MTDALTPAGLKYIREWAASGNEERRTSDVPDNVVAFAVQDSTDSPWWCYLSPAGLTIARLADAFEQACDAAEECADRLGPHYPMPRESRINALRANRRELLG